jgi:hypothetical protein
MSIVKTVWAEFIGLFVDDGSLAAAVVLWLLACWLVLPRVPLAPALPPIILVTGLAAILAESAIRRAGKHH